MALGWPSVEWGLRHISSRELTEWQIYDREYDPIGRNRFDWLAAMVARTLAEIWRDPNKRPQPYEISDFSPKWGTQESDERTIDEWSEQEQITWIEMLNAAYGGKDMRGK